jgi:soluble lytic murein transglycosylase-like protein
MICAAFAVAGGYSCAHAQTMRGTDDQTAFAVPRVALPGAAAVALPQPLSPADAARIRRIFALQAAGNLAEAARETATLDTTLLLGPILAERYLGGRVQPTPAELAAWLARFGDQPDAPAIRALRARLVPDALPATAPRPLPAAARVSAGAVRALFVEHRDADAVAAALALDARPSQRGSGDGLLAGGLAAWRGGDAATARALFDATWRTAPAAALRAAGAYWAARAARREADAGAAILWLRRAAEEQDTFYGRLAGRSLGPSRACLRDETLGIADLDAIAARPAGRRAFALLQVGEKHRAEAEFRALWADGGQNDLLTRPLVLIARAVGLTQFAAELAAGAPPVAEPAPPPPLHPAGGFVVEQPLVYALVHHESNFRTEAVSHDGALGLMQIKPATARAVIHDSGLRGMQAARLRDPAVNLAVGQHYLRELAEDESIDGDLMRLLAGYTQGLFGLKRWADGVDDRGDPLLFLEAIPNPATHAFVEDILASSWHYAAALHQPAASLDALAAGRFPRLLTAAAPPAPCGSGAAR